MGFNYSVGFLHEINQSRTPLAYNIQELFRWIIDISVIQLLEEKKIKKFDFIITENYHTRLGEDMENKLIEKINEAGNTGALYGENYNRIPIPQSEIDKLNGVLVQNDGY